MNMPRNLLWAFGACCAFARFGFAQTEYEDHLPAMAHVTRFTLPEPEHVRTVAVRDYRGQAWRVLPADAAKVFATALRHATPCPPKSAKPGVLPSVGLPRYVLRVTLMTQAGYYVYVHGDFSTLTIADRRYCFSESVSAELNGLFETAMASP